jgi:hypothetical protein
MREDEMRRVLLEMCRDFDFRLKSRRSAVPGMLGSLLLAGGCGQALYAAPEVGVPAVDSGSDAADASDSGSAPVDGGPVVEYMAPGADG